MLTLSFTEEKFINLSVDNKIKKVIFALNDFLDNKKDFVYITNLVSWLNKYSSYKVIVPENIDQCNYLKNNLLDILHTENPFVEKLPFDDRNKAGKILPVTILLEDIRSPYNVGSIFRNAESFGAEKIILTGITPAPEENSKILRVSREVNVDYIYHENPADAIKNYKKNGYKIYSIEKTANSINIKKGKIELPLMIIFGNEEFGVSKEILAISDAIIHIGMLGKKNSLNVSVASGIALYEIINKNIIKG